MSDRAFLTAFAASAVCHALLLGVQLIRLWPFPLAPQRMPDALNVVYERSVEAEHPAPLHRALSQGGPQAGPGLLGGRLRAQISESSPGLSAVSGLEASRHAVVDLTNLIEAAQGDPVLLSYFGAIREQIQRAANRRPWLEGELTQGLVYVAFALRADGEVSSVSVVKDRSAASAHLQDAAARIIQSASPFPPFPPSLAGGAKTIVVPLEFLLSS